MGEFLEGVIIFYFCKVRKNGVQVNVIFYGNYIEARVLCVLLFLVMSTRVIWYTRTIVVLMLYSRVLFE